MAAVETIVVGAGITGLSIAYHLRERDAGPVLILERTGIGAEASGVQPGGVRQQWSTRENCELARESFLFYRELGERLQVSLKPALEECGYLFVAESESTLAQMEAGVSRQQSWGIPSVLLSAEEAFRIAPAIARGEILGASYCAEDGYFDRPQSVVEAFAEAARARGVTIERAEVTGLEAHGGGWAVKVADGRRLIAGRVVVAAGYGTPEIFRPLGVELPIEKEAKHVFYSSPIRERLLEPLVVAPDSRFAAKQLADGRVLASDLRASGDPTFAADGWRGSVRDAFRRLTPVLEYVDLGLLVTGFYDMTPDHQAVIDEIDDDLWVAAGFSGHGFMMAPAVGRAVAAALEGEPLGRRFLPFSWERFAGGELLPETQVV